MKKILLFISFIYCSYSYGQNMIDQYLSGSPTYTEIANSTKMISQPKDLDFKPYTKELWILNRGNTNGGTNVIIYNAGEPNQTSEFRRESHSGHFMIYPTAFAFGDNGNFANTNEIKNTSSATNSTFMGPSLWSGDTSIFAKVFQNNWQTGYPLGSHLDMLHQSPFSMGIAHDTENVYWVFDGHNGNLCKYDFGEDHSAGYDDHSNGRIWRYRDVNLTRQNNVSSHMVLDKSTGWLYIVDAGVKIVKRVNTNTGTQSGNLSVPSTSPEPLLGYWAVTGAVVENIDTFSASQPCGIDVFNGRLVVGDYTNGDITIYDVTGTAPTKLGTITTGQPGITGLKIGYDGKIWFVNQTLNTVVRIDPSAVVSNDVSVEAITSPSVNNYVAHYFYTGFNECDLSITPSIIIKNAGNNTLTSATINYKIDNDPTQTYQWSGSLDSGATTIVTLNAISTTAGNHVIMVEAVNANGVADQNPANNAKAGAFRNHETTVDFPFKEDFSSTTFPPSGWTSIGFNGHNKHTRDASIGSFGTNNGCMKMDNFNGNENISGQKDYMMTSRINFTEATSNTTLTFDVAYAQYANFTNDALMVKVSTDCGNTWKQIYNKSGATLATRPLTTSEFRPTATEWRKESVSLAAYAGMPDVMIQFQTTSGFGNMLYIDEINIDNTLSIGDYNKAIFAVYPNPTKDLITIENTGAVNKKMTVNVYDSMGKLVKQSEQWANGKMDLNLSDQTNGTYFIQIVDGKYTHQEKLIILK